ncbi:MAG TPA: hypothetical protein PKK94_21855 [Leptospiraceae bacterium]|nr:hypothetical protein [Leptospiraceae bacterium]
MKNKKDTEKNGRSRLISESSVRLAEKFRPLITEKRSKLDPDGYTVHNEFEIEITKTNLVILVNTGWNCGWTVKKAPKKSEFQSGDRLCASDWMVDNYGPEGIALKYNDKEFVVNWHDQPEIRDKAVQSEAQKFAENLRETLKAGSFLELAEICWYLTDADEVGLWRMRNVARVTLNPSDARSFSDRT